MCGQSAAGAPDDVGDLLDAVPLGDAQHLSGDLALGSNPLPHAHAHPHARFADDALSEPHHPHQPYLHHHPTGQARPTSDPAALSHSHSHPNPFLARYLQTHPDGVDAGAVCVIWVTRRVRDVGDKACA